MNCNRITRQAAGFTMLELLIVMGLFMVVLLPVMGVFSSSYQSYVVQDEITAAQQEVRAALMMMERDVRMAGSGIRGLITPLGRKYGVEFDNAFNSDNNSDKLFVVYKDPEASPCDDGNNTSAYGFCDQMVDLLTNDKPGKNTSGNNNSVEFRVQTELKDSGWDVGCYCGGEEYKHPYANKTPLPVIVTAPDGKSSALLYLTQVQNTGGGQDKIQNRDLKVEDWPDYEGRVLSQFPPGSTVSFLSWDSVPEIEYYLGGTNDTNLIRREKSGTEVVLAENVEDLQFALIGDFNENGTINMADACGAADGSTDCINAADLKADSANAADLIDRIAYVRISILIRTAREHKELSADPRPEVEDNTGTWAADYYRRRLVQQDVMVRNMGLTDTNP